MHKKALALVLVLTMVLLSACNGNPTVTSSPSTAPPPSEPAETEITITIWHYFSGAVQAALDEIVAAFNEGPGKEANIVVIAENNGRTAELERKVQLASESGIKDLPEIVHGYPDIMAVLHAKEQLADLSNYLTEEEIAGYFESYVAEGSQFGDGKLRLIPLAKSTELLFYNQTRWDSVKEEIGCSDEDLTTWEGIAKAGKAYFDQFGQQFFVIGSEANFFYLTGYQQGKEYVTVGEVNLDRDAVERTYNFIANGLEEGWLVVKDNTKAYPSDWINDNTAVCYVDSNSGTTYANPGSLAEGSDGSVDTLAFMTYPVWSDAVNRAVIQQGAGMAVTAKGEETEKAAAFFLSYLTSPENTAIFSMASGYIPVQKTAVEAEDFKLFIEGKAADGTELPAQQLKVAEAINKALEQFETYKMYYTPAFEGSNLVRVAVGDEITKVFTGIHEDFDSFFTSLENSIEEQLSGR